MLTPSHLSSPLANPGQTNKPHSFLTHSFFTIIFPIHLLILAYIPRSLRQQQKRQRSSTRTLLRGLRHVTAVQVSFAPSPSSPPRPLPSQSLYPEFKRIPLLACLLTGLLFLIALGNRPVRDRPVRPERDLQTDVRGRLQADLVDLIVSTSPSPNGCPFPPFLADVAGGVGRGGFWIRMELILGFLGWVCSGLVLL